MRELNRCWGLLGTIGLVILIAGTLKEPEVLGDKREGKPEEETYESIFEQVALPRIKNKETPIYLTDAEFSELYTLRAEEPCESERIVELSYEDALLIMQIAAAEAGDDLDGQEWTMRVILNRLEDGSFGGSIREIVSAPGQFEVYKSGRYLTTDIYTSTHLALAAIEGGWDESQGALYFEASSNSDHSWHKKNREFIAEISGQRYYK